MPLSYSNNNYTLLSGQESQPKYSYDVWNYPFTVYSRTSSSFGITGKSDLTNGRFNWLTIGY